MAEPQAPAEAPLPLETVVIEVTHTPEGRESVNLQARGIRHTGQIWERIVAIVQHGLRAATVQAATQQPEASRILDPGGFRVPPGAGLH